jgi:hypothetical protein
MLGLSCCVSCDVDQQLPCFKGEGQTGEKQLHAQLMGWSFDIELQHRHFSELL